MRIITPTNNIIGIISPNNWINNRFVKQQIKSKKYLGNDIINQLIEQCLENPIPEVLQKVYFSIENEKRILDDFVKSMGTEGYHPFGKVITRRDGLIAGYLYRNALQKGCVSIWIDRSRIFDNELKKIMDLLAEQKVSHNDLSFRPFWDISWINNYAKYLDEHVKASTLTMLVGIDPIKIRYLGSNMIADSLDTPIDSIELSVASEHGSFVKATLALGRDCKFPNSSTIFNVQYEGLDRLFICNISVADLLTVKRYIKRNKWEKVTKADMVALDEDIKAILRVVGVEIY